MFGCSSLSAILLVLSSYLAATEALDLGIDEYFDFTLGLGLPSSLCSSNSLLQIGIQQSLDLGLSSKRDDEIAAIQARAEPVLKAVLQVSAVAHVEAKLFKVTLDFKTAASAQLFARFANTARTARITGLGAPSQPNVVVVGANANTGIDNLFAFSVSLLVEASVHNGLFCLPDGLGIELDIDVNANVQVGGLWDQYFPQNIQYTLDQNFDDAREFVPTKREDFEKRLDLNLNVDLGLDLSLLPRLQAPSALLPNYCWAALCDAPSLSLSASVSLTTSETMSLTSGNDATTTGTGEQGESSSGSSTGVTGTNTGSSATTSGDLTGTGSSSTASTGSGSSSTTVSETGSFPLSVQSGTGTGPSRSIGNSRTGSSGPSGPSVYSVSYETSGAGSSEPASSTFPITLAAVTTHDIDTTVITITSCHEHKCTKVPVTTGVTTVTLESTSYTTYCPLISETAPVTMAPAHSAATSVESILVPPPQSVGMLPLESVFLHPGIPYALKNNTVVTEITTAATPLAPVSTGSTSTITVGITETVGSDRMTTQAMPPPSSSISVPPSVSVNATMNINETGAAFAVRGSVWSLLAAVVVGLNI